MKSVVNLFIGGLKGLFLAPLLPWYFEKQFFRQIYHGIISFAKLCKKLTLKDIYQSWHIILGLILISPFLLLYLIPVKVIPILFQRFIIPSILSVCALFVGFALGAYIGFKEARDSASTKKPPLQDLFEVLKAHYANYLYKEDADDIKHYLGRTYKGFTEDLSSKKILLIKDLLKRPNCEAHIRRLIEGYPTSFREFQRLKHESILYILACPDLYPGPGHSLNRSGLGFSNDTKITDKLLTILFINRELTYDDFLTLLPNQSIVISRIKPLYEAAVYDHLNVKLFLIPRAGKRNLFGQYQSRNGMDYKAIPFLIVSMLIPHAQNFYQFFNPPSSLPSDSPLGTTKDLQQIELSDQADETKPDTPNL